MTSLSSSQGHTSLLGAGPAQGAPAALPLPLLALQPFPREATGRVLGTGAVSAMMQLRSFCHPVPGLWL